MNLQQFTSSLQEQFANKGLRLQINRKATEYLFYIFKKPTNKEWEGLEVIRISELESWMIADTMPKQLEQYL